jgi:hypothetical protein
MLVTMSRGEFDVRGVNSVGREYLTADSDV